ncbi:hypothetical protein [Bacillus atrophaeus]|uniref:hypothetical protein n=1 Tax=Bacillus atrophaeus TaxID=1452 RepID=UPI00227D9C5E|nr:hypothetical protein [Bacillus atrophaeus]MCY9159611.1 hypothetical protein [Bacillus atrophaeus]MED4854493.1 hypothetical protein [Bacillus atrophaeus]
MKILWCICVLCMVTAGCSVHKPVPKGELGKTAALEAQAHPKELQGEWLTYKIKDSRVYVECMLNDFHFKTGPASVRDKQGYLAVYSDGKKLRNEYTAAFIVRHLSKGNHRLTVEVISRHPDYKQISKTWDVFIR